MKSAVLAWRSYSDLQDIALATVFFKSSESGNVSYLVFFLLIF